MSDSKEWKIFNVTKSSEIPVDYRWTAKNLAFYKASATYPINGRLKTYEAKFTFSVGASGLGFWQFDSTSKDSEPYHVSGALVKNIDLSNDKAFNELMSANCSLYFDIMKQKVLDHLQKEASEVSFKFDLLDYGMIYRKPVEEQLSLFQVTKKAC